MADNWFSDIGSNNTANTSNNNNWFSDIGNIDTTSTNDTSNENWFSDVGKEVNTTPNTAKKKELTGYQKFDKSVGGFLPWGTDPIDLTKVTGQDVWNEVKNVGKDILNLPENFQHGLAQGVTFGQWDNITNWLDSKLGVDGMTQKRNEKFAPQSFLGNTAEVAGNLTGSLLPIETLGAGAGGLLVKAGMTPATTFAGKVGQSALKDAIAGGAYGGIEAGLNGEDGEDITKSVLRNAALFGGLGALGTGIKEFSSLKKPPAPDSIPLDSPESFNQKISWEKTPEKTTWGEWGNNILTGFVDRFRPAEQLEHSIIDGARQNIDILNKQGKSIPGYLTDYLNDIGKDGLHSADKSFYKQLRLFSGVPEKINNFIENNLKPIIQDVEKAGYTTEDLSQYALAKHALDVNKTLDKNGKLIKSGFTDAEANSIITKYKSPEMDLAHQRLMDYNQSLLDVLVKNKMITDETRNLLMTKYPNYTPLFRDMLDGESASGIDNLTHNIESDAIANIGKPIYQLKGSKRKVINPIENIIKNTYKILNSSEKNKVMSYFDNNLGFLEDLGLVKKVPKNKQGDFPNTLFYYKEVKQYDNSGKLVFNSSGKPRLVIEKQYVSVSDELYKMLKNLDAEQSNTLMSGLAKMASILRTGATVNPAFIIRNPWRDHFAAYTFSKSGYRFWSDWFRGLSEAVGKGKDTKAGDYIPDFLTFYVPKSLKNKLYNSKINFNVYQAKGYYDKFLDNNGGYGSIISYDRDLQNEAIREMTGYNFDARIKDLANSDNKWDWLKFPFKELNINVLQKLRNYSEICELSTKIGEYGAAKRLGISDMEAAYRSRDLMDFGRAGNVIKEVNKIVSFINAGIQGASRTYRTFSEDGRFIYNEVKNANGKINKIKTTGKELYGSSYGKATKALTTMTVGVFLAQKILANEQQKKIIDDAPAWLKSTFWLVPVPGTDTIVRIPKPFDIGIPFANLPERFLNEYFNNKPDAFKNFGSDSIMQLIPPMMISGLTPIIEGMTNYSFFRQGQIIPQREANLMKKDQYDINTSETAKKLADIVRPITNNIPALKNFGSPRIMDNTITGYTAGLGKLGTDVIDKVLQTTGMVDAKNKPSKKLSELPIINAFTVNEASTGQSMQDLYDLKTSLTEEKNSAKLNREPFKGNGKLAYINSQTGLIAEINKQIKTTQENKSINPDIKRKRMDVLNNKRNDISIRAMKRLNNWK